MSLFMKIDSYSFQSPVRDSNQDLFWPEPGVNGNITHPFSSKLLATRGYLFVLASGAGMPPYGLEACRLGVQMLVHRYYDEEMTFLDAQSTLLSSFEAANEGVYHHITLEPPEDILGNSMIAAVIQGDELIVASVGLCGAQLVRDANVNRLVPLTRPPLSHDGLRCPYVVKPLLGCSTPLLIRTDVVDPMQIRSPYVELASRIRVKQGDTLVLHNDDVPGLVTEEEIVDVVKCGKESARQLAEMISGSLGSQINVTVTVVRFS